VNGEQSTSGRGGRPTLAQIDHRSPKTRVAAGLFSVYIR
jgi:hypothetical protein